MAFINKLPNTGVLIITVAIAPVAAVVYPALYNFNYHGIVSSKLSSINDPNPAPTHPPAKFIEPILPYAT
jgi:hypothetical protein